MLSYIVFPRALGQSEGSGDENGGWSDGVV